MDEGSTIARRTRAPRYALALLVVLAGVYALVGWHMVVCREELPDAARLPVRVCGPPTATDAPVTAVAALVALLLAPDLGEAGIAGVTLKRQIAEARADAATARADVAALRLTVTALHRQDVAVTNTAAATVTVPDGAAIIDALAKVGALNVAPRGSPPPGKRATESLPRSVSDAGHAFLVSAATDALPGLLPKPLAGATVVAVVDEVTLVAGPDTTADVLRQVVTDPAGPLRRALADHAPSESFVGPPARPRLVLAVPARAPDGEVVGALAVVLPEGTREGTDLSGLARAAEAFTALAVYVRTRHVPGREDGPAHGSGEP